MRITWNGHSNFYLEHAGSRVVIDPFFEGNPSAPGGHERIAEADAVFLTHDHGDHVGQALDICAATGAQLVGVFDTVNALVERGLDPDQGLGMNLGGTVQVAGLAATMVQAEHSSATGVAAGFILTWPDGLCVYHAGDTALFASMGLFPEFHAIDLALLPIGGWFTMDPPQAAHACKLLRCGAVAPMHWGTFPILEQNTDAFAKELERRAPGTRLVQLTVGEPVEFTP